MLIGISSSSRRSCIEGFTWINILDLTSWVRVVKFPTCKSGSRTLEHKEAHKMQAGRFGEPEEIGGVIAFLCTPAADYISGINLPVDGGRTASL